MNVLLIAYACEPNKGSEPGVGWNWAIRLSKFVNLTVVTRKNNKSLIDNKLSNKKYCNINFVYHDLESLVFIKNTSSFSLKLYYLFWVVSLKKLVKTLIQKNDFDIIHFITFNTFTVSPPITSFGIKAIWGPIGGGILGHTESFKKISIISYSKEAVRNFFVKILAKSFYMNKALLKFDKVLFANTDTAKLLGYKNNIKIELETGIDERNIIFNATNDKSSARINVLASGILEPRKGFHLLLDSLSLVKSDVVLNILGDGSLKKYLYDIAYKNDLNVNFLGKIPFDEVTNFYRQSDVFIFPSLRDTSGNVVLEAMSQGLPIIAFDHQGMHDILTNECAIKIPVTNYKQMVKNLASALDKLADNRKLRSEMGKASIQRIRDNYLWGDKAKRMVDIYKEVLNENSPST